MAADVDILAVDGVAVVDYIVGRVVVVVVVVVELDNMVVDAVVVSSLLASFLPSIRAAVHVRSVGCSCWGVGSALEVGVSAVLVLHIGGAASCVVAAAVPAAVAALAAVAVAVAVSLSRYWLKHIMI